MRCPCCDVELKNRSIKNLETDECPECKGIWFEDDELRKAKDSEDRDLNWMDFEIWKNKDKFKPRPRNLACPQCNQTLVAVDYGDTNVEIDYCPHCKGSWLDKGEFKAIIEALTNELLTKTFSEYIKASIEEAKEIVTGPESFLSEWKDFTAVCRMMQYRMFVENPKLLDTMINIQRAHPIK
ncbi:MAG: TFIIB-type zinc ribbon-containing protein [Planctomycetota bacterium]|jgi:Zn-finger nucleic acid-binding protein